MVASPDPAVDIDPGLTPTAAEHPRTVNATLESRRTLFGGNTTKFLTEKLRSAPWVAYSADVSLRLTRRGVWIELLDITGSKHVYVARMPHGSYQTGKCTVWCAGEPGITPVALSFDQGATVFKGETRIVESWWGLIGLADLFN